MKKVIIISRDTVPTYSSECIAYQNFTTTPNSEGSRNIHNYVVAYVIKLLLSKPEEEKWNRITYDSELPNYDIVWGTHEGNYEDAFEQNPEGANNMEEYRKAKINSILNGILEPKEVQPDNKPYVNFQYNGFDVHFVFLNRIFDSFVNGSNEYDKLIDNDSRLDFIEAICRDCGLLDASGKLIDGEEKAILYIHDKEWYESSNPISVLLDNKKVPGRNIYSNILENYFSTIKVFLHTPGGFFSEITNLNFTEEDESVAYLMRSHF